MGRPPFQQHHDGGPTSSTANLTGLQPNTTYHYHFYVLDSDRCPMTAVT